MKIALVKMSRLIKQNQSTKTKIFLYQLFLIFLLLAATVITFPNKVFSINEKAGEDLFIQHCSGCHINGGNVIRRNKTLKVKDLKKNGLDNPEKIAEIASKGIGSMSGYKEALGPQGDEIVAKWVWKQAQNAWTQG